MTRDAKQRFADTFQPLIPWVAGVLLDSSYKRLLDHILGCRPTTTMVQRVWRDLRGDLCDTKTLPALQSSSYRRRLRESWKRILLSKAKVSMELRQAARSSAAMYRLEEIDLKQIPKFDALEAEFAAKVDDVSLMPQSLADALPPNKVVAPRHVKALLAKLGGIENYGEELVSVIYQLLLWPDTVVEDLKRLTGKQKQVLIDAFWSPEERPSEIQEFVKAMSASLFNLSNDLPASERITRRIIGFLLIRNLFGQGSGPYKEAKERSIETPIGDGITLGDTLADTRSEEAFSSLEDRLDLEISLDDLPAAQRRAVERFLEAEKTGEDPKDLCAKLGEKYETVQRNFERAIKRLKR